MQEDAKFTWDDVKQIRDEIALKVHLASKDLRDRWDALRPRFQEIERTVEREGQRATKAVGESLKAIGKRLRELRDQISDEVKENRNSP
jgi:hypothetical protein